MRRFLSSFDESLRLLKPDYDVDKWDALLVSILLRKLKPDLRTVFELKVESRKFPTLDSLLKMLENRCLSLEASSMSKVDSNSYSTSNKGRAPNKTSKSLSMGVVAESTAACLFCKGDHDRLYKCPKFKELAPRERYKTAMNLKVCLNCLSPKHLVAQCLSKYICKACQKPHNSLLCFSDNNASLVNQPTQGPLQSLVSSPPEPIVAQLDGRSESNLATTLSTSLSSSSKSHISSSLLATAQVVVENGKGDRCTARALLDLGSQSTFMCERIARRLKLVTTPIQHRVIGVSGTLATTSHSRTCCHLVIPGKPPSMLPVECLLLPKVSDDLPSEPIPKGDWAHLVGKHLADPKFFSPAPVQMILGADILPELLKEGFCQGKDGTLSTLNTRLGLVVFGKLSVNTQSVTHSHFSKVSESIIEDDSQLHGLVERFWSVHEPPQTTCLSVNDKFCEDNFIATVNRSQTGRYVVELLFLQPPDLGTSRKMAERKLLALEKRLSSQPDVQAAYIAFMRDYLDQGHMQPAPSEPGDSPVYYLPHHGVLRPGAPLDKIRVVFNASAPTSNGKSLNSCMLPGPKLQPSLSTLLLRFRCSKVAFSCDIAQMYRQIIVAKPQWDLQRILWRFSVGEPIREYHLTTLTYGEAAAPFLAQRVIRHLADANKENYPEACDILFRKTFMDDALGNADTPEKAVMLATQLSDILGSAGFKLHKWASNCEKLLEKFSPPNAKAETVSFDQERPTVVVRVLGVNWEPKTDVFCYKVNIDLDIPCTKRSILSFIAKTFDPLGWLTPVLLIPKLWLQKLWIDEVNWDDPVPDPMPTLWSQYLEEFSQLSDFTLPRCIKTSPSSEFTLLGFCDASESAYGAVIYLREFDPLSKSCAIHLLIAKGRVAPLKMVSLARLELCSAVMLRELLQEVTEALSTEIVLQPAFVWSDSTNTLHWVSSSSCRWKTFIANRVANIQEFLSPSQWRHVPSLENPADSLTRGQRPHELLANELFISGPSWLKLPESEWPMSSFVDIQPSPEVMESKKPIEVTLSHFSHRNHLYPWKLNRD